MTAKRFLLRCECGELLYTDAPDWIARKHVGHRAWPATGGTFLEWLAVKLKVVEKGGWKEWALSWLSACRGI